MTRVRTSCLALLLLLGLLAIAAPSRAADNGLTGEGSSWPSSAIQDWVTAEHGAGPSVSWIPTGTSAGLSGFANGTDDFAATELPYGITGATPDQPARASTYVPIVGDGVALMYNLSSNGHRITGLGMSPATVAGIFSGTITSWDDPAIAADNPGVSLPDVPIVAVVNSAAAATTDALTSWLTDEAPTDWTCGRTVMFTSCPVYSSSVQIARPGEYGVAAGIYQPSDNGAIGYLENTTAQSSSLPVVSLRNALGHFTQPTSTNMSVSLTQATVTGDQTEDLDGVHAFRDPRAYPLAHYAYAVIPTSATDASMTAGKRQALADFLTYGLCAGQRGADSSGYAPLPLNLVEAGLTQVRRLGPTADSGAVGGVDIPDLSTLLAQCDNPTFDKSDLGKDVLGLGIDGLPAPSGTPAVAGVARVGSNLAARVGTWEHTVGFSFQWLADGSPIAGATDPVHAVAPAELGKRLAVRVTAVSGDEQTTTVTTAATSAVLRGDLQLSEAWVSGRPRVGHVLYVGVLMYIYAPQAESDVPGVWPYVPAPTPTVRYQWYVGWRPIPGATHRHLVVRRTQIGKQLRVRVTVSAPGYTTRALRPYASGLVIR